MGRQHAGIVATCVALATALTPHVASGQAAGSITPVDRHSEVEALLRSSDSRQAAWGAWYAGRDRLTEMAPLLERVVTTRVASVTTNDVAAVDIALDALIQIEALVSPEAALLAFDRRPAQSLILLSRTKESDDSILRIVAGERDLRWFAAANIALARHSRGLAHAVLAGLELSATVTISDEGGTVVGIGFGEGIGCGAVGRAEGLPPWASYELTSIPTPGAVVLATGPTAVYYQRSVSIAGRTPASRSSTGRTPTARDRLEYLAAAGRFSMTDVPLMGDESFAVRSDVRLAIDREITRIRADLTHRYQLLLARLIDAGELTPEEQAELAVPRLTLRIHDLTK